MPAHILLCQLTCSRPPSYSSQGLSKVFAEFDQDGSGYLDGSELVHALRLMEPGLLDEEVREGIQQGGMRGRRPDVTSVGEECQRVLDSQCTTSP